MANVETVLDYKFTTPDGVKMSCDVTYDNDSQNVERRYYDKDGKELENLYYCENGAVVLNMLEQAVAFKTLEELHKANRTLYNFLKARLSNE